MIKLKKRFLLLLIISILCITLSSCSLLDDFFEAISVESYSGTKPPTTTAGEDDTNSTTTSTTVPITDTDTTTSITSSVTTTKDDTTSATTTEYIYTYTTSIDEEYSYGYLDLERYENKDSLKALYNSLYSKLLEFSLSDRDLDGEVIDVEEEYLIFTNEFYSTYGLTEDEAFLVLKVLELDHPEFYFVDNLVRISTRTINDVVSEMSLFIYADDEYHNHEVRQEFDRNIQLFVNEALSDISEEDTERQKVRKVHDYIISHATYAFLEDGITPDDSANAHNIVGITSYGKGVCESYAELFTYILNKLGIKCLTVTGWGYADKSWEAHAWNYVRINGTYYAFDLTWNDSTSSMNYYGLSESNIKKDHSVTTAEGISNARLEYLYVLPTLSNINLIF